MLDSTLRVKEMSCIDDAVCMHLSALPGAKATLVLDVQVEAPGNSPEGTARSGSENCRVLPFGSQPCEGA